MSEVSAATRYSVVIPVGSRHSDLAELYDEYRRGLDALGRPYETIFVVDGPQPDATAKLRALCKEDDRITVLNLSRSFGEATALAAGLERATGSIIITLPAYYQIEASGIPSLVSALDNADMSDRTPLAARRRSIRNTAPFGFSRNSEGVHGLGLSRPRLRSARDAQASHRGRVAVRRPTSLHRTVGAESGISGHRGRRAAIPRRTGTTAGTRSRHMRIARSTSSRCCSSSGSRRSRCASSECSAFRCSCSAPRSFSSWSSSGCSSTRASRIARRSYWRLCSRCSACSSSRSGCSASSSSLRTRGASRITRCRKSSISPRASVARGDAGKSTHGRPEVVAEDSGGRFGRNLVKAQEP